MSCQPLSKFLGLLLAICIYGDAYGLQAAGSAGTSTRSGHLGDTLTPAALNTNHSAFTRAVAAGEKRDQALAHWQSFQQSGVDTDLIRSLENLAVAINTGTNLPSVATPNGQAAFLFLLTSAVAPLVRLSYGKMVWMALPYTIVLGAVGYAAVTYVL